MCRCYPNGASRRKDKRLATSLFAKARFRAAQTGVSLSHPSAERPPAGRPTATKNKSPSAYSSQSELGGFRLLFSFLNSAMWRPRCQSSTSWSRTTRICLRLRCRACCAHSWAKNWSKSIRRSFALSPLIARRSTPSSVETSRTPASGLVEEVCTLVARTFNGTSVRTQPSIRYVPQIDTAPRFEASRYPWLIPWGCFRVISCGTLALMP